MLKKKYLFLIFLFVEFNNKSFCSTINSIPDTVLHSQKVQREDVPFKQHFNGCAGILTLTNNQIIFVAKKSKNDKINFVIAYSDILIIKPINILFFPNRIRIETKDGHNYKLFTYKREKIIEVVRNKLK